MGRQDDSEGVDAPGPRFPCRSGGVGLLDEACDNGCGNWGGNCDGHGRNGYDNLHDRTTYDDNGNYHGNGDGNSDDTTDGVTRDGRDGDRFDDDRANKDHNLVEARGGRGEDGRDRSEPFSFFSVVVAAVVALDSTCFSATDHYASVAPGNANPHARVPQR